MIDMEVMVLRALILSVIVTMSLVVAISPACTKPEGEYLLFRDGSQSSIFLIQSEFSYGVFNQDFPYQLPGKIYPQKGDPAVIIQGTLRNDYQEDSWFGLSADVYNSDGQKVGNVVSSFLPMETCVVLFAPRGSVTPFEIYVNYDGTDITKYQLFLCIGPVDQPPP